MKKFKKSEIAIYVIAIMLVAAGYFNYETFQPMVNESTAVDAEDVSNEASIGDAVLVNSQEMVNEEKKDSSSIQNENKDTENVEEDDLKDYYASSKLERNKMYAEMITNYEDIISNESSSEVQKSIATEEIKKINDIKNAIMICENLILTKGFQNCIIFINDENVNVVVRIEEGLSENKVAIIQNIISRELKKDIEDIHISEN